jgi:ribosomal protein uL13
MKIIDGENIVLGRLASYVSKEVLKGEEFIVLNCDKVVITGNKRDIKNKFEERVRRGGHSQKGPFHIKSSERIVKRTIRGMLPDHRVGRGKIAFKKIKCYNGIPKEFEDSTKIALNEKNFNKFILVKEMIK